MRIVQNDRTNRVFKFDSVLLHQFEFLGVCERTHLLAPINSSSDLVKRFDPAQLQIEMLQDDDRADRRIRIRSHLGVSTERETEWFVGQSLALSRLQRYVFAKRCGANVGNRGTSVDGLAPVKHQNTTVVL